MFQGLATGPEFKVQSTNHVESKHTAREDLYKRAIGEDQSWDSGW